LSLTSVNPVKQAKLFLNKRQHAKNHTKASLKFMNLEQTTANYTHNNVMYTGKKGIHIYIQLTENVRMIQKPKF